MVYPPVGTSLGTFYCKPFEDADSARAHLERLKTAYPKLIFNLDVIPDHMDENLASWSMLVASK